VKIVRNFSRERPKPTRMDVTNAKGPSPASPSASPNPSAEARPRADRAAGAATGTPFRALVAAGMTKGGRGKASAAAPKGAKTKAEPRGHGHEHAHCTMPKSLEPSRDDAKHTLRALDRDRAHDEDLELGAGKHGKLRGARASESDVLDPSMRHLAHLAPPTAAATFDANARGVAHETVVRGRSLEELLPALVRKIAWAGDRQRGTVRLELGAGAYAGTTLVVHADGGKVRVEAFGGGGDLDRLRARLDARLRSHGLDVESVV